MGTTKSEKFTLQQNEMAGIAKALGHPARIAILQEILKRNSCICGDLVTSIGLAQSTISQHLKELKNSGIIKGEIEGTSVCYCINKDKWNTISELFSSFFDESSKLNNDCC